MEKETKDILQHYKYFSPKRIPSKKKGGSILFTILNVLQPSNDDLRYSNPCNLKSSLYHIETKCGLIRKRIFLLYTNPSFRLIRLIVVVSVEFMSKLSFVEMIFFLPQYIWCYCFTSLLLLMQPVETYYEDHSFESRDFESSSASPVSLNLNEPQILC